MSIALLFDACWITAKVGDVYSDSFRPVSSAKQAAEKIVFLCSPGAKKMFRFKTGDADSPRAGPPTESPYLLSPVGRENPLGNTIVSPKRAPRKIARSPFKVGAVTWCTRFK